MKFRRRRTHSETPHFNLTPLIDTMFLLLIFFMTTTTFNKQSQLNIDLPHSKGEISSEQQHTIRIIIDANGSFAINDHQHSLVNTQLETLKQALRQITDDQKNSSLLISADANAPHHAIMTAMEAARDLGLSRLSFEAQHPSEPQEK